MWEQEKTRSNGERLEMGVDGEKSRGKREYEKEI